MSVTAAQQLSDVEDAIQAILQGQTAEYYDGRNRFVKLSLPELYAIRAQLKSEIDASDNGCFKVIEL